MLTVVTKDSVIKYSVGKFVLHFVVIIIFFFSYLVKMFGDCGRFIAKDEKTRAFDL